MLAETAEQVKVQRLAEKLIDAHRATVEWLTVVLAEEALGGPAALVATPLQKVAGTVARAAGAPVRFVHNTVNSALDTVQQAGEETTERFGAVADRATALTDAVRETLTVSRAAGLRRAERIARREGNTEVADATKAAREELGDVTADELPIKGYDSMATAGCRQGDQGAGHPARHPGDHPLRGDPQEAVEPRQRRADPPGRPGQGSGRRLQLIDGTLSATRARIPTGVRALGMYGE